MSWFMRIHAGRCAGAITNSQSVARDLDYVCKGRLKINTVYNAVDLERLNPRGPVLDLDAMCGLPPTVGGIVRVGLIATMARWKGHEVFLRAVAALGEGLPLRAYVIGGPIYETCGSQYTLQELRSLASELGIAQRVGFTGFVEDAAAAIRALDVIVHASTRPEPFGLAIAEAMACAKPVIVSVAGGAAEIISGNDALTHTPGDTTALAGCIRKLALDTELRIQLGKKGRLTAEARFDRQRLAHEILGIYDSALLSRS
jgi:glycosyltransferase involved in cell wall biosynthesis